MSAMHNPCHPGEILREEVFNPLGLSITEAASQLGLSRGRLSGIVNARSAISPKIAIRLEMAFGQPAELWLRLQNTYDLQQARQRNRGLSVKPISPARTAAGE